MRPAMTAAEAFDQSAYGAGIALRMACREFAIAVLNVLPDWWWVRYERGLTRIGLAVLRIERRDAIAELERGPK
jgi:hypothetical protein